jgi:hypothetical protein
MKKKEDLTILRKWFTNWDDQLGLPTGNILRNVRICHGIGIISLEIKI